jgi:hypothetical protein
MVLPLKGKDKLVACPAGYATGLFVGGYAMHITVRWTPIRVNI